MADLAQLVAVPPRNSVNQGLSSLRSSVMLDLIGVPGNRARGQHCGDVTNAKLLGMLETRNVARLQFPLRMPARVLDLVEEVFDDVKREDAEVFEKARTNGSLCVRPISGSGSFSNHSWGCAVDLGFGPASAGGFITADPREDGLTELGLLKLVPFFNRLGFFWGGVFSFEDSMHFEVSEQLARSLFAPGGGGPLPPLPPPPGGGTPNVKLKHPRLAMDPGLREVAAGKRILQRSGVRSESVGLVQDALNELGKKAFQVALGRDQKFRGFFGPKTESAVKNFQASENLDADGVVGDDTLIALDTRLTEKEGRGDLKHVLFRNNAILQAVEAGDLILERSGTPVDGIGEIQDALNLLGTKEPKFRVNLGANNKFRGFFGPKTEAAIIAFQKKQQLMVDGRVGPQTIRALDQALLKLKPIPLPGPIPGAGGYLPPESARPILGTVPLGDGKELDPLAFGITSSDVEVLMQMPDGVLFFEGGMQTDADGSPRAPVIDDFGQLQTSYNFPNQQGQKRFVDAEKVNYIVLPGNNADPADRFFKKMGFKPGDVAAVIHDGKLEFAMFADVGPTNKLGEGSVHLVQALGLDPFVGGKIRRGIPDEVVYIVFPKSKPAGLTPGNANQKIAAAGKSRFTALGGVA